MISIWKTEKFELEGVNAGDGYLCISLKQDGEVYHVVNVYAPRSTEGKRLLRAELVQLKSRLCDGELCIGGYFNAVLVCSERKGTTNHDYQTKKIPS